MHFPPPCFCPLALASVLSLAGTAVAFADTPKPLHLHILSGAREYKANESLQAFIADLEKAYRVNCTASWGHDGAKTVAGLEALAKADLLVVYARRMNLEEKQMKLVRAHWEAGKPVIGIRTASHAFQEKDNGHFDRKVLGNHYLGHYGNVKYEVVTPEAQRKHPVLGGVGAIKSYRLYKAGDLAKGTVILQSADVGQGVEPVTLVHEYKGGRVFYTSLGVPEDFARPAFRRLLVNAVFWTTGKTTGDYRKAGEKLRK